MLDYLQAPKIGRVSLVELLQIYKVAADDMA